MIDIDLRHGGYTSIQEYEENRPDGPLPRTLPSSTGGGGRHLFYRYPDDGAPVPGRNPWLRGVDIKSDGGYVVLPGSKHSSGGTYAWADRSAPITKMPADVLQSIRLRSSDGVRDGPPDTDDILDGVPEGERDETLFRLACRLRRQLGDNARKAVEHLILRAASGCTPPFPEADALKKVDQAFKQDHGDAAIWDWLELHPCNDRGNAGRFVDKHYEIIRFVPSHDRWYVWNGTYWVHDRSDTQIIRLAQDVEHILRKEAEFMPNEATRNKMLKFAERTGDTARMTAFLKQAKADPRIQATYEQFDGNPYELACLNGVVDQTTGHLKPLATESGLPNHWCTKLVPYEYEPDAKSELWEATLKRLFVDGELVELFRLFVGYSITGVSTEEKSLWMYGDTGNGKSTVLTAIRNALGPEYVGVAHEDLLVKASGKHDDIKAHIVDKRLVIAIETDESAQLDERQFKSLTGGDAINARQLYEQSNDYKPVWKIVLATNHLPDIKNFDDAIRRRLLIVPTAETVPENQRVPYLKQVLAQEEHAKAILAWAIRGTRDWYAELVRNTYDPTKPSTGIVVPEVVRLATDQYQQDNAPLHQNWLDQRWMITWSAEDKINTADLWDDFDGWAKQRRITEKIGKQKFFKWLQSLDGVSRSQNGRVFTGLRLKTASYSFQF